MSAEPAAIENSGLPDWWQWTVRGDELAANYEKVWLERAAMLKAMRAHPGRWEGLREFYAHDPQGVIAFCNSWATTFDPRAAGTGMPTMMPFLLFPKQAEFMAWMRDRWMKRENGLVEKSRDMGISWCCIAFAVWLWIFHKDSVTGFGSYKEEYVDKNGDPKSLFWKARYIIDRLPFELQPRGYDKDSDAPYMRIMNKSGGSTIFGEAGGNIGRGARASLYVVDEAAHIAQGDSIDAALSQTTNSQIDVSTPNGEGNTFWRKRFGGNVKVFVFDWRDDPRKDEAWYLKQKAKMDPVALAQEVDRDYSASVSNSFIPSLIVTEAQARGPRDVKALGGLRAGLDVARFGDDSNVLTIRRGRVLLKQVRWRKSDIESTAGRARQEILAFREPFEQIAVDSIGVGAGAADMLANFPGWRDIVKDVNSSLRMSDGQHYNLRAFMWTQMKDWLLTASIPNDQALRSALTALRYFYRGGEMLMESKDDAKKRGIKSPDEGDSLALTFAYPGSKKRVEINPERVVSYVTDPETGC